jgi:hypothetical protein
MIPINPVQDLPDRITNLQCILEELEPNIRNKRVRSQCENVGTKLAESKSAIWALGVALDKYNVV